MATDRALMRRIKSRDDDAFAELVTRHGGRMLRVARRMLGGHADAEDAVQRAFIRCLTSAGSYRSEWAVSTWLYRILTNVCVDEIRRRAAGGGWEERHDVSHAERTATRLDVQRALARVPTEARLLLVLRYVEGLSYGELARVRGISVNTVKSQLARGKSILRAALRGGSR